MGYGNWELLKQKIIEKVEFRYNWFLKSRSPFELGKRVDSLIHLVEKENAKKNPPPKPNPKSKPSTKSKSKPATKLTGKKRRAPEKGRKSKVSAQKQTF